MKQYVPLLCIVSIFISISTLFLFLFCVLRNSSTINGSQSTLWKPFVCWMVKQVAVEQPGSWGWRRWRKWGALRVVGRSLDPCRWGQGQVWELIWCLEGEGLTLVKGSWMGRCKNRTSYQFCPLQSKTVGFEGKGGVEGVSLDLKVVSLEQ